VTLIEDRKVLVVERRPPLPARLDALLAAPGMRLFPVRITGWRRECDEQDHRLVPLAEGPYRGPDRIRRSLRLSMCADCESVCVRDVSVDDLRAYDPGGRGMARPTARARLRRRDLVLGWYTGARRHQREYR
jgi:hypothetical protein